MNLVNEYSNFVVVTYWWGKGNINYNTQRPCPEDLGKGVVKKKPITYDALIKRLKTTCIKHNCNYLIKEYPEFTAKGMYQKAINFKPQFILYALSQCYPRNVVYVDADMVIKRYPAIFDTLDIDFMSRGWNSDGREDEEICFDPYVLEVSGGILYFGNTNLSKALLKQWMHQIALNPGKADDRLLTIILNKNSLIAKLNIIELPLEYLWLTLNYDYLEYSKVYIEHPECLTGEERAAELGADDDRVPKNYIADIQNKVRCSTTINLFFEYIFFPTYLCQSSLEPFLTTMDEYGIFEVVRFKDKYGPYNHIYKNNISLMDDLKHVALNPKINKVYLTYADLHLPNQHIINEYHNIPLIISYLKRGKNVVYIPKYSQNVEMHLHHISRTTNHEFICRNLNKSTKRYKKEYLLVMDATHPIYFSRESKTLRHLLYMCRTVGDISRRFNQSFQFLSRIRCRWV